MKKSKFLQSSKDVLTRSFNPAKCKTSLRLAGSRLKLLRNKKEAQVKQMKKEIAQLLESGQDRTARIRVEHVIREEKLMAAYDLLEIYCELIVARLPIIESQKNCPIDLKEAIASVIFASPRCGDVPELLDGRKQFTAKYGKDFTTAAIELRPQCGVGRMLVEKLSAMAPDGQTKIKILSAIAEEHNVKWDPNSYEEKVSVPPSDLLNGASTFGEESKASVEPPRFEAGDVQALPGSHKVHSSPLNFSQQNPSTSVGAEKLASGQTSGVNMACQPEARPPGHARAQLFQGESHSSSPDRQRWNMEFKDATSAAQAAAESAELASLAARAAAELSSYGRITRQYSTESHKSDDYILKDEGPETHLNSKFSREQFSEESLNISSSEHTRLQKEQIKPNDSKTATRFDAGRGGLEEYSQSASLKSKASIYEDPLDHVVPVVDQYSHQTSLEEVSGVEMGREKQSFKHEAETENSWPEKSENFLEERTGKQQSISSSRSHSSVSDDVNIFANPENLKLENDASENPFVSIGKGDIHGEASQTGSHEYAAAVFDRFDSDTDDHGFDTGPSYDEPDSELHLPSLSQTSLEHLSINTDSWIPGSSNKILRPTSPPLFFMRENSSPDFSENLTSRDDTQLDNFAPVAFDESDGATSESDEDINARHIGLEDTRDLLHKGNESGQSVGSRFEDKTRLSVGLPLKDEGHSVFDREQLSLSSDDELKYEGIPRERNKAKKFDADPPGKLSLVMPSAEQPALGSEDTHIESNDIDYESSPKSEERLNFGKLTGGLRHRGYNKLPFFKNRLDASSPVKKETETTVTTSSTTPPAVEDPRISSILDHKKSTRTPDPQSESDGDSSDEEEYLQKSSVKKQEMHTPSAQKEAKTKLSLGTSNSIFGSDSSDLDEDPPKKPLTWKSHPRSGISRRTKASNSSSGTISHSKTQPGSETLDSDAGMDGKPTSSHNSETQKKPVSQRRNSGKLDYYERPISEKVDPMPAKSNFWGPPKQNDSAKETTVVMQESKIELRSEAQDSDASLGRKTTNSYSPNTSFTRNSSQLRNSKQPNLATVASKPNNSKFSGTPEKPILEKATATTVQENWKSSPVQETSSPQQEPQALISSGSPKTETLDNTSSNKDDGVKRASHVHPKLPDYDTLFASLRKNRS
ncbi:Spindle pole body protein [Handroanthus impetiginosus]|uniref:Spindle pole body protein n=1 Tax=Handroanthus impetiginosus TaxID=429701 RepID=A0A2G9HAF0_9LAMI|nr:Spindle pole body protein [Handroanthus impetiginosus]